VLQGDSSGYTPGALLIALDPAVTDSESLRLEVGQTLAQAWRDTDWGIACPQGLAVEAVPGIPGYQDADACTILVMDPDQAAVERMAHYWDPRVLVTVAIVFGLVSLLTGTMVIANTFQVMIAGRVRTLALLRAVGATRSQIRRAVLLEALAVGLVAAVAGLVAGWGLIRLALGVAKTMYPSLPLPATAQLSAGAVALALAVGVVTTVVASLLPARLATRVAPVDALRPQTAPSLAARAGRARLIWSFLIAAVGAALIGLGLFVTNSDAGGRLGSGLELGAAAGVLGGALVAGGVLLGAVFWLPKVVGRIAGWVAKRRGGARMAAANVVRNPRRAAASATALMIGVTLVAAMLVGAASLNRSLDRYVGDQKPVDLQVGYLRSGYWAADADEGEYWSPLEDAAVSDELVDQLETVPGVTGSATIAAAEVVIEDDSGLAITYVVNGVDPARLEATLDKEGFAERLRPNVVLVNSDLNDRLAHMGEYLVDAAYSEDWSEPSPLPVSGTTRAARTTGGEQLELAFVHAPELDSYESWTAAMMTDQATLDALGDQTTVAALFSVDQRADPMLIQDRVLDLVTSMSPDLTAAYLVDGSAVQKAEARKVIDTMLLIGLALLTVSLVVAFIGISNTLSLSVIERRRENALLRALGLTRGQTRWMMAVEALVIAAVAGLMGIVFGTAYGFVACALLAGSTDFVSLVFPVWGLAALFVLTLAAGLAASVLPGHRAARTPPAAALALE
jgi:putative ABC transport system permease protein